MWLFYFITSFLPLRTLLLISASVWLLSFVLNFFKSLYNKVVLINKLPGPRVNPFLGNIPLEVVRHIGSNFDSSKDLYYNLMQSLHGYTHVFAKERIYRLWVGPEPWLILWKPESIEVVLSHNFLLQKSSQYDFLHPWLGTGLLTSTGNKWRSRRKMLVPAFHFKILHDFVPVFNEQAAFLVEKLKRDAQKGFPIDIVPEVTACALDIICETIMGVKIGAQTSPNNDYCRAVNEVGECWLERLIQPTYWLDSLYYKSKSGKHFAEKLNLLHEFTRKVIRQRKNQILGITDDTFPSTNCNSGGVNVNSANESEMRERKAFLDLLLDQHLNGGDLTEEGIREEVDTFMFEGHDTTSMALSWIIFLLGHHPDVQEKLWPEIDQLFDELESEQSSESNSNSSSSTSSSPSSSSCNVQIPLSMVKDLQYLDCVVKEGLRLCPSVPFIGRRLHEDTVIPAGDNNYTVPAGTILYVFIYMLHRDPETFPSPETFNPDRFLPENSAGRNPFAFVPFSAGPRNCIGQRFALAELKIVLAFLLRHYKFESLEARDKIIANMEMVLRPKVPLKVKLHERIRNKSTDQ